MWIRRCCRSDHENGDNHADSDDQFDHNDDNDDQLDHGGDNEKHDDHCGSGDAAGLIRKNKDDDYDDQNYDNRSDNGGHFHHNSW